MWRDLKDRWYKWAADKAAKKRATPGSASLTSDELNEIGVRVRGADWLPGAIALIKK